MLIIIASYIAMYNVIFVGAGVQSTEETARGDPSEK